MSLSPASNSFSLPSIASSISRTADALALQDIYKLKLVLEEHEKNIARHELYEVMVKGILAQNNNPPETVRIAQDMLRVIEESLARLPEEKVKDSARAHQTKDFILA